MAVTSKQIVDFLLANPNMSDAQIAATMQEFSVTPAQMAEAVGVPVTSVQERYVAAAPDTQTAENINKLASQILAQGTTEAWTGGLPPETAALYMASDLAKSGVTNIDQIAKGDSGIVNAMTGEKLVSGYGERTGGNLWSGSYEGKGNTGFGVDFDAQGKPLFFTQGASSSTLKSDLLKAAAIAGAVYGLGGFEGLLGGAATGAAGTAGMTAAELAQLDIALGGAGGSAGAASLANALATGATVPTLTNLTGGSGVLTGALGGITAESVAAKLAADAALQAELLNAGAGAFTPTYVPPITTPPIVTPPIVTPPVVTPPVIPPVVTPPVVTPPFVTPSISDVIKTIGTVATIAAIPSIVSPKTTAPTGFDIVPIPTDWKTPNKATTAPFTALSPINFGTQNLLKGTQFERFLDPNYGQVPEAVKYSQPSNLSYNDLMGILGSRQGMPSASNLSINDIISGIQNQYGQAPTRTMG
jgi:hypothetical protein